MDGRMDQFSFESDIKDVKKVRLEKDNRKILTEIPFNSTVNSETNSDDKHLCVVCNQRFDKFELELHFLECIQDQDESQQIKDTPNEDVIPSHLKDSERIDAKERSYKCEYCPKAFTTKGNLKTHERIHTGEKPFKCIYCPEAFTQSSNLIVHERTHTGEKPYGCPTCDRHFADLGTMTRHKKLHRKGRPYQCNNCNLFFEIDTFAEHVKKSDRCANEVIPKIGLIH